MGPTGGDGATIEPADRPGVATAGDDSDAPPAHVAGATERLWIDLRTAVGAAVVGGEEPLRLIVLALLAGGHVLIEDVPGTGKTLLARSVARALGLATARIQGTPDLLPSDVTGASLFEPDGLRFVPGPVFTNILLVDEINRATPRTQSALLEAMQERQVSVEGTTYPLADPFIVLATQNPVEFEGTFALPQAQLDRFIVRATIGYPDASAEGRIARRHQRDVEPLDRVERVAEAAQLAALRDDVRQIHVADEVEAYAVAIVRATRDQPELALGASPRASVALYRIAQAAAALHGRAFVLPDDVKDVARAVLAHRLVVDLDAGLRGASAESTVATILDRVPVPPVED